MTELKPLILKSQGKALFEAVERANLNPADFQLVARQWDYWERSDRGYTYSTDSAPTLVHKASEFYFMFVEVPSEDRHWLNHGAAYVVQLSPAPDEWVKTSRGLGWDDIVAWLERWLEAVNNELTGPDVWEQLAGTSLPLGHPTDNTPFSLDEQQTLHSKLDKLLAHAQATYDLTAESSARIEHDIGYLAKATGRVGRLDWQNIAVSTLVQWAFGKVMDMAAWRDIWHRFWVEAQNFLAGNQPPMLP